MENETSERKAQGGQSRAVDVAVDVARDARFRGADEYHTGKKKRDRGECEG
jgi:hypothetical protein